MTNKILRNAGTDRVVDAIRATPERQRYLRGLRTWVGFRQIGIPVERGERMAISGNSPARCRIAI